MEPSEPERAAEAREARRSGECYEKTAFLPKKSNLKCFSLPDELGSQIGLIYSESQIFRIFWPMFVA